MLKVENIVFGYNKTTVLDGISFHAEAGENITIIGESGSGKSTLLNLIYGQHDLDQGEITWKSIKILGPSYNLVVGYDFIKSVTQEFDLMPYISVEENIGKFLSRFYPEERQKRTEELLKVVELDEFAKTKVQFLSGGQKQRVAIARALAKEPEILLLDEPFSHIDNFKKQSLRRSIFNYLKEKNITCIVATHDKNDVLGFADDMLVLHDNKIIAQDSPEQLYKAPKTPLIASFFGEFNEIDGEIYYAHQIKIVEHSDALTPLSTGLKAIVNQSYFNGNNWLVELDYNSQNLIIEHHEQITKGTTVYFSLSE